MYIVLYVACVIQVVSTGANELNDVLFCCVIVIVIVIVIVVVVRV